MDVWGQYAGAAPATNLECVPCCCGPGYGAGVSPGKDCGSFDRKSLPANQTSQHLLGTAVRDQSLVSPRSQQEREKLILSGSLGEGREKHLSQPMKSGQLLQGNEPRKPQLPCSGAVYSETWLPAWIMEVREPWARWGRCWLTLMS